MKNPLGMKKHQILSMCIGWCVFPGGRLHVSLYVPDGNLVFALVPDGFILDLPPCVFRPVALEMGLRRISVFLKGSRVALAALISNMLHQKRITRS